MVAAVSSPPYLAAGVILAVLCCTAPILRTASAAAPARAPQLAPQYDDPEGRTLALLHDGNFWAYAESKANLVVGFYAPWCQHCADWARDFKRVAQELQAAGVFVAKVDAVSLQSPDPAANLGNHTVVSPFVPGVDAAKRLKVTSYPTVRVLHFGRWNEDLRPPRPADELIEFMKVWARPATVPLYTVEEVNAAVVAHQHRYTIVISFYEEERLGLAFGELSHHFKGSLLFFHVAGRDHALGAQDPAKRAILDHFHTRNTFVIFRHASPEDRRVLGRSGQANHSAVARDAESVAAHTVFDSLNPDHIVHRDFLRPVGDPQLSQWGMMPEPDAPREEKDSLIAFLSIHGLSPVAVLTKANRHLYNMRSVGLVFLFLPLGESGQATAGTTSSSTGSDESCSEGDAQGGEQQPAAPEGTGGTEPGGCTTTMHPEQGVVRDCISGSSTSKKRSRVPSAKGHFLTKAERSVLSTSLFELSRRPALRNFSFLIVNPFDSPQIFRAFGFAESDLRPFNAYDTFGSAYDPDAVAAQVPFPLHRTNLIGVTLHRNKYRYTYDYYAPALLDRFLTDIEAGRLVPFVHSAEIPTETSGLTPGSGRPVLLVYDNFEELVKRDRNTDALVLFANPFESLSQRAVSAFLKLAEAETGNRQLLIGVYDAMHNDSPKGFDYESLPVVWFVPQHMKQEITFAAPSPRSAADRADPGATGYETHSVRFRPVRYEGDYGEVSIRHFVTKHASGANTGPGSTPMGRSSPGDSTPKSDRPTPLQGKPGAQKQTGDDESSKVPGHQGGATYIRTVKADGEVEFRRSDGTGSP